MKLKFVSLSARRRIHNCIIELSLCLLELKQESIQITHYNVMIWIVISMVTTEDIAEK